MENAPVVLIVFNRPDLTVRMLEILRKIKPTKLYVVADGPRPDIEGEVYRVSNVRSIIDNEINWPCQVRKNYSAENLGSGIRVSTGISWVFEQEQQAIILEDDCLPDISFFAYCSELLNRYQDDTRIMHIAGSSFEVDKKSVPNTYLYSHYPFIWGWATWKRAWLKYDYGMTLWKSKEVQQKISHFRRSFGDALYWKDRFNSITPKTRDAWDYQWVFCCWVNNGLAIRPTSNLISNAGFREDATHTTNSASNFSERALSAMEWPYVSPSCMMVDIFADREFSKNFNYNLKTRFKREVKNILNYFGFSFKL